MIRVLNLFVILLLIWFLNASFQNRQVKVIGATEILGTEKTPDYYSQHLLIRQFNSQGNLQSRIKTEKLSHYADQQHAVVVAPELVLYGTEEGLEDGVRKVTSDIGEIMDSSRDLKLKDNVLLVVTDADQQQKIKLQTTELYYKIAEHVLWTDSSVTAESTQGQFAANGLTFDIKTDQLLLENKVNIHYDMQ